MSSALDYKDLALDYQDALVAHQQQGTIPTVVNRYGELPSNLDYKDLARDYQDAIVLHHQQQHHQGTIPPDTRTGELPSDLEYKDSGRNLSFFVNGKVKAPPPPGPFENENENEKETTPGKKRGYSCMLLSATAVLIFVGVIVGAVVASTGDDRKKNSMENNSQLTLTPTHSPVDVTATMNDSPAYPTASPTITPPLWQPVTASILGETLDENLGHAVDLSADGSILAASAYGYDLVDGDTLANAGQVRVYRRSSSNDESSWQVIGRFNGSDTDDYYGFALALSKNGNTLAIGSPFPSRTFLDQPAGVVDVFRRDESDRWGRLGNSLGVPMNYSDLGFAVDLNGDGSVCAFSYNGDDTIEFNTGSFEVYQYNSLLQDWQQIGGRIFGDNANDFFGYAIRLNHAGNIVASGAVASGSGAGLAGRQGYVKVFQYDFEEGNWSQLGQTIRAIAGPNEAAPNSFGAALALSTDGLIVAVGAPHRSQSEQPGFVQVFQYNTIDSSWELQGETIQGKTEGELFGYSLVS